MIWQKKISIILSGLRNQSGGQIHRWVMRNLLYQVILFSPIEALGFGLQIDFKICAKSQSANEIRRKQIFVKSQSAVLNFCHITRFFFSAIIILLVVLLRRPINFSFKSSCEVHWIMMFQKDVMCSPFCVNCSYERKSESWEKI